MVSIKKCKVYTPKIVAEFMITSLNIDFRKEFKILEPAVGIGNIFLLLIEKFLLDSVDFDDLYIKSKLENCFVAYDIETQSLKVLNEKLNKLLLKYSRDITVNWCLIQMDILDISRSKKLYNQFTHIICNPPYIFYKDLSEHQKNLIKKNNYETISLENYDIYLVFIEEITKYLISDGKASVIIPFNYTRVKYAKKSLDYLISKKLLEKIYGFKSKNLFKEISPLSCIINLKGNSDTTYFYSMNNDMRKIEKVEQFYNKIEIGKEKNIECVEISKYCYVYGGVAPLNNKVFMIKENEILSVDQKTIIFKKQNKHFKLNIRSVRVVYSINEKRDNKKMYMVFPYVFDEKNKLVKINFEEDLLLKKYLFYMLKNKDKFYGKTQNLKYYNLKKLCFSSTVSSLKHTVVDYGYIYGGVCVVVKEKFQKYQDEIFDAIICKIGELKEVIERESLVYSGGYFNLKSTQLSKLKIKRITGEENE